MTLQAERPSTVPATGQATVQVPASDAKSKELIALRASQVPRGVSALTPLYAVKAEGASLWDVSGRRYIDFAGGIGVLNTGYSHPKIIAAVKAQLENFTHTCFQVVGYESYLRLAEKLNQIVPVKAGHTNKTVFVSTGAEATENAIKIARAYTNRPGIISFDSSFHGRTLMGMSLTGKQKPYKQNFGPFAPEVYKTPFPIPYSGITTKDALAGLENLFNTQVSPDQVAAIIIEPVQGEGGFNPASPAFMRSLRHICDKHGILFINDEIQSGYGRTGKMWAIEYSGVTPDLTCIAKSLAGGLPLAAVTGRADIMDAPHPGGLGGTYAGNPLACAAGLAVLEVFEEDKILEQGERLGVRLEQELNALMNDFVGIGEVRGLGAMMAIEIVKDRQTKRPDADAATRVANAALERGLIIIKAGMHGNVVRILVPLNANPEELETGFAALRGAFEAAYKK
jgi:4-aminobutyrate aminotransferase / (S)-3-amino-2-methylpropionate transaminase / 5-aminovalerate transaminase